MPNKTRKSKSPKKNLFEYDPSMKWGNFMMENNARHPERGAEARARLAEIEAQPRKAKSKSPEMRKWNMTHKAKRASPKGKRVSPKAKKMSPKAKPRKGKVMRECKDDAKGCERHMKQGDCKFCHRDEPEFAMLRPDQKVAKGGVRKA
jgi:hypothetical protein